VGQLRGIRESNHGKEGDAKGRMDPTGTRPRLLPLTAEDNQSSDLIAVAIDRRAIEVIRQATARTEAFR
jgi:hypothetical protein